MVDRDKSRDSNDCHHHRRNKLDQENPGFSQLKPHSAVFDFLNQLFRIPFPCDVVAHEDAAQRQEDIVRQHADEIENVIVQYGDIRQRPKGQGTGNSKKENRRG